MPIDSFVTCPAPLDRVRAIEVRQDLPTGSAIWITVWFVPGVDMRELKAVCIGPETHRQTEYPHVIEIVRAWGWIGFVSILTPSKRVVDEQAWLEDGGLEKRSAIKLGLAKVQARLDRNADLAAPAYAILAKSAAKHIAKRDAAQAL